MPAKAAASTCLNSPLLIPFLADEPTGQLDTLTGAGIIELLKQVVAQTGVTVLIASHDPNVHAAADWVLELQDGRLLKAEQTAPMTQEMTAQRLGKL